MTIRKQKLMRNVAESVLFVENILKEMKCMQIIKCLGVNDEKL
jgi:hypothetical protein